MRRLLVVIVMCIAMGHRGECVVPRYKLRQRHRDNDVLKPSEEDPHKHQHKTENTILYPDYDFASMYQDLPLTDEQEAVPEAFYYGIYGDMEAKGWLWPGRMGEASSNSSCGLVRSVPGYLRGSDVMRPEGISHVYQKYTEAYGIPVVGSPGVPSRALTRACYVLRFMLADRHDIRELFYRNYGRVAVLERAQRLRDLPEYAFLPEAFDHAKSHGLGAIRMAPVSSAGAENILCSSHDANRREDVLVRMLAQGIAQLAARHLIPDFRSSLERLYEGAMASGWWDHTYAAHSPDSYFGQAVQAYFSVSGFARPANGVYNEISSRTMLTSYDPEIHSVIRELFPCGNTYIKRCNTRHFEVYQKLRMDCIGPGYIPPRH